MIAMPLFGPPVHCGDMSKLSTFPMCGKAGLLMGLGVLALMFGCTKRQRIIVIDDWWNVTKGRKSKCQPERHFGF